MSTAKTRSVTTVLKNILLLTRNVDRSVSFYTEGLGLKLMHHSEDYAEVRDSNDFRIGFQRVDSHAFTTTGYSPILNFQLKDGQDIYEQVSKLEKEYGAALDGEICKDDNFEIATLRSKDGHMVSLMKIKYDEQIDDEDGLNTVNQEATLDPRQQEIRRLLDSLKL
ncbi:unnamed protein product [Moneuplotes crassus]|uniref:VOC domain-containing protein n=1 Tax=Euplotes crassus TaxID=5936 RepID=A0AAD1Y2Z9_EUPCR|nr:unnamed protein product [Moneuplotes crassus]